MQGNTSPLISPRTKTLVNNTNKTTKDDKYPWLDTDDKQWHDKEIIVKGQT